MIVLQIIAIAFSGVWISHVSGIVKNIKWHLKIKRLKPFDCEKCMAAWIGFFFFYFKNIPIPETIIYSLTASVLSIIILKFVNHDFKATL